MAEIAAAAIIAKATSADAAIFAWFGFIDFQRPAADFFTIELLNGRRGLFASGHFDESEPS